MKRDGSAASEASSSSVGGAPTLDAPPPLAAAAALGPPPSGRESGVTSASSLSRSSARRTSESSPGVTARSCSHDRGRERPPLCCGSEAVPSDVEPGRLCAALSDPSARPSTLPSALAAPLDASGERPLRESAPAWLAPPSCVVSSSTVCSVACGAPSPLPSSAGAPPLLAPPPSSRTGSEAVSCSCKANRVGGETIHGSVRVV
mmetsp:Transcript_2802/g.8292  ORF Transcript_2802/g.8292 Transcript_2802/m.8292 type:complete len:204 (-) Transcript_2802:1988-2599(-)